MFLPNSSPIIVALDGISKEKALRIAKTTRGMVWGFKISDLFFEDATIIKRLKKFGRVFVDVKLYDIPNTVKNIVARISAAGADIITVHASGGVEMMKTAKKAKGKSKIVAVTILTSFGENSKLIKNNSSKLVKNAIEAGVDGIVCSAHELEFILKIKKAANLLKVIPGIRPSWYKHKDDQKRTTTPFEAMQAGANLLVIGRPIVRSENPAEAITKILTEIYK